MPKLSICIPSYNRVQFLPTALDSITSQSGPEIEIVICDNGSQDRTPEVVQAWQKKHPQIRYVRLDKNIGPDRCFVRSVEAASGEYCWLLGDDDIIEKGSIQLILSKLDTLPDLTGITVNVQLYDHLLEKKLSPKHGQAPWQSERLFTEPYQCLKHLFSKWGYLSAQIVKRESWMKIAQSEEAAPFYNTAYVLIYIIGRMVQNHPNWLYVHEKCVGCRSGNDSFLMELGRFGRFSLDVVGYDRIARALVQDKGRLYRPLMSSICRSPLFYQIRDMKCSYSIPHLSTQCLRLCFRRLWSVPKFWHMLLPLILTPGFLLKRLRNFYRFINPKT